MLRKTLFIAFTALLVTSCSLKNITSAEDIKAHIIAFGIYELDGPSKIIDTPTSTMGKSTKITDIRYVDETLDIPAKIGVHFGYTFQVSGLQQGEQITLRRLYKHPEFNGKNEFVRVVQYTSDKTGAFTGKAGYGFDEEVELEPGKWRIEIWYKNKVIVGKTFNVISN